MICEITKKNQAVLVLYVYIYIYNKYKCNQKSLKWYFNNELFILFSDGIVSLESSLHFSVKFAFFF